MYVYNYIHILRAARNDKGLPPTTINANANTLVCTGAWCGQLYLCIKHVMLRRKHTYDVASRIRYVMSHQACDVATCIKHVILRLYAAPNVG